MTSKEKAWECCKEIYRRQFKEANPSADFDELRKKGITNKQGWFMKYYLIQRRQEEIIDEVCKEFKIVGIWKRKLERKILIWLIGDQVQMVR